MGAANVVPGVSGGTIALITGIYEQLILSLKSFDIQAIKLATSFKFRDLMKHINGPFLIILFLGIAVSIVSLAKLFKILMDDPTYEVWIMAYFFGLILMSIYSVGKTIEKWGAAQIISLLIGLIIAVGLALVSPATENDSFFYLLICGVVAICSMILPGLSGSFVLIIMGNYKLIMLDAVSELNLNVLIPVAIGSILGLVAFSQFLGWVLKNYRDQTIALMTGFILGSLLIIWPWKNEVLLTNEQGNPILKKGKEIVSGYEWFLPELNSTTTWVAIAAIVLGILTILVMEVATSRQDSLATQS